MLIQIAKQWNCWSKWIHNRKLFQGCVIYIHNVPSNCTFSARKTLTVACKSVGAHASVWGKTTLITGSAGGAGAGPPTCKMGTFFHIPLALTMPISNNFQSRRASGETPKLWVLQFQSLGVSPEAPFNWKLLPIGIISVKGIWKNAPILQVVGPAPDPPTPLVIRVVLLHTEPAVQDLCPDTVYI